MYANSNELLVPLCQVVGSYNSPARRIHKFVPAVRLQNFASFSQGQGIRIEILGQDTGATGYACQFSHCSTAERS